MNLTFIYLRHLLLKLFYSLMCFVCDFKKDLQFAVIYC